jgi:acetyltransferase-like isoleucine patch superfamily enzyme
VRRRGNDDPRQVPLRRFVSPESLRWVVAHRAFTPYYLVRYWRFLRLRVRHPDVVTEGFVFLGRGVEIVARRGYGRVVLGRWVHLGDRCSLRAHEGTLRIGDKTVLGREDTLNCYLDLEIGPRCLVADWVYVGDFDHRYDDLDVPVKDQGIVKTPVRIGADVWIGVKASVLRGAQIGDGCVVGAHAVVKGTHPAGAVLAGVPARVLRMRGVTDGAGTATTPTPLRAVDEGGTRWRG